jgi:ferredoxin/flavodoxin
MANNAMSVGIFYFSGTGNTEIVADLLAKEFRGRAASAELIRVEDILKNKVDFDINKYDIIGIGYPIHALNAPRIIFDFIKVLPAAKSKKVFILKCPGDPILRGGPLSPVKKNLEQKGYEVFYEGVIVMPSNVFLRIDEKMVKLICDVAARKVKKIAEDIIAGKTQLFRYGLFSGIFAKLFSDGENRGARMFGKHLRTSKSCNLCNICVENCPENNISVVDNRINFSNNCLLCMKCIYNCPKAAIAPSFMKFFIIKGGYYKIKEIMGDSNIKGALPSHKNKLYSPSFYRYLKDS